MPVMEIVMCHGVVCEIPPKLWQCVYTFFTKTLIWTQLCRNFDTPKVWKCRNSNEFVCHVSKFQHFFLGVSKSQHFCLPCVEIPTLFFWMCRNPNTFFWMCRNPNTLFLNVSKFRHISKKSVGISTHAKQKCWDFDTSREKCCDFDTLQREVLRFRHIQKKVLEFRHMPNRSVGISTLSHFLGVLEFRHNCVQTFQLVCLSGAVFMCKKVIKPWTLFAEAQRKKLLFGWTPFLAVFGLKTGCVQQNRKFSRPLGIN